MHPKLLAVHILNAATWNSAIQKQYPQDRGDLTHLFIQLACPAGGSESWNQSQPATSFQRTCEMQATDTSAIKTLKGQIR